ncbi:hypothetical protein EIP91_005736 [Steccherinum ochraceum]|uniref:Uncharacterized protein n=1 Tax=Steccherinum ochraceum TaxID=92696 RepID=A0A4R0RRT0_9APHY|nr:hypothetical protein EIP91_005736 [Steccherinum ochraceum]
MALSKHHHRQQPSDPFSDQATVSYSSYGVPTLTRNAPPQQAAARPPPVPPKVPSKASRMPNGDNVADAVREVVTVRRIDPTSPPRTRMGRSQTQLPPPIIKPVSPRRSASQDSTPVPPEKDKGKARRPANKKGSSHADVIDRLDFSGVGPMFHHDGPFDACAPSRNRHRTKAPMYAWSGAPLEDRDAFAAAREIPPSAYPSSPYPTTPGVYAPYEAPKKKHDAIAEAWGVHEPEPFEDFSAGGGAIPRNSGDFSTTATRAAAGNGARKTRDNRDPRDKYREYLDDAQPSPSRRQGGRRPNLPPPQPVFAADGEVESSSPPSPTLPASPGAPKRTKSLMHRIRKMRDSPNVPVNYDETNPEQELPSSPAENGAVKPTRPTHRSQNSFLGRLGRGANVPSKEGISPTSESEQFVYVDDPARVRKDKSLPATPPIKGETSPTEYADGYFESAAGGYATSPGGLGRRTSLLKKVKGVVKHQR